MSDSFAKLALPAILALPVYHQTHAATLPDAIYWVDRNGNPEVNAPGSYTGVDCRSSGTGLCSPTETAVIITSPVPYVEADGSSIVAPPSGMGPGSEATMRYFYEVTGPTTINVPVNIHGVIDVAAGGPIGAAFAYIKYGDSPYNSNSYQTFSACESGGDTALYCGSRGWTVRSGGTLDAKLTVPSGTSQFIEIRASGYSNSVNGAGYWYAMADPVVTIDPTFAAAHPGYSIIYSAGVNIASVPVPAAAWLMASGMAGIMVLRQGRSRRFCRKFTKDR